MEPLDPRHELPAGQSLPALPPHPDPLELPRPNRGRMWSWLMSLVLSVTVSFALAIFLVSRQLTGPSIAAVVTITFMIGTFVVHAVVDRAR